jgi:hypothetical protein
MCRWRRTWAAPVCLGLMTWMFRSTDALAEEDESAHGGLPRKGDIVLSDLVGASMVGTGPVTGTGWFALSTGDSQGGSTTSTQLALAPQIDFFVTNHITVGLSAIADYQLTSYNDYAGGSGTTPTYVASQIEKDSSA